MTNKKTLLISATSLEKAVQMLNSYFYSTTYTIDENLVVSNKNGVRNELIAEAKKGRIIIYTTAF